MKRGRLVAVVNSKTGEVRVYMGISPARAVVLAYEQSRGNFNWWNIRNPMDHKGFRETPSGGFACGHWEVFKEEKP